MVLQVNQKTTTANAAAEEELGAARRPLGGSARGRTAEQDDGSTFSWTGLGDVAHRGIGTNPASAILSSLRAAMAEPAKKLSDLFEMRFLELDKNNNSNIALSALIVAVTYRPVGEQKPTAVAFHTLLLEGSSDPFQSKFVPHNGVNFEDPRYASAAADGAFIDEVRNAVALVYPNMRQLDADIEVVPRDYNIEDDKLVHRTTANALQACCMALEEISGNFPGLNIALAKNDAQLVIKPAFNAPTETDAVGLPIRGETIAQLVASANQRDRRNAVVDRTEVITTVKGFMNLVYEPANAQARNPFARSTGQVLSQQTYRAEYVITEMICAQLPSLGSQLLALIPAFGLAENNLWAEAFRPAQFGTSDVDFKDIGAIGLEIDGVEERVPTKSDTYRPEFHHDMIAAYFHPGMLVSIDVAEAGANTWLTSEFGLAGSGDTDAIDRIFDTANFLTNGEFLKIYGDHPRAVFLDHTVGIHQGFFRDAEGVMRDLREIDHLYVLNATGDTDLSVVKDWSDSLLDRRSPEVVLNSLRANIIRKLVRPTITGMYRRQTFNPAFFEALVRGALAAGLNASIQLPTIENAGQPRATARYGQSAVIGGRDSGSMFASQYGQNGQTVSQAGFGRWARR
jgi:hypothetical protein